jgi:cyclopropane fatty-acyl-phospholipid synthase-like methyltransferase
MLRRARSILRDLIKSQGSPVEPETKIARDAAEYWSRSATDRFQKEMSHWQGSGGKFSQDSDWRLIGERSFAMFEELCAQTRHPRPVRRMLEWGPGGGSNAIRFAPETAEFIGVDISEPNLNECERQLASIGYRGLSKVLIDPNRPEDVLALVEPGVDFVLSTAVFQHFPSKEYGVRVLSVLHSLLAPTGIAMLQIRYDDGTEQWRPKQGDYNKNAITFTSYGIAEFWKHCEVAGMRPLSVRLDMSINYAYYYVSNK